MNTLRGKIYATLGKLTKETLHNGYIRYSEVNSLIDNTCNDYEAKIKDLMEIVQQQSDLLEMYSEDNEASNNAHLIKQFKAKDERIK